MMMIILKDLILIKLKNSHKLYREIFLSRVKTKFKTVLLIKEIPLFLLDKNKKYRIRKLSIHGKFKICFLFYQIKMKLRINKKMIYLVKFKN